MAVTYIIYYYHVLIYLPIYYTQWIDSVTSDNHRKFFYRECIVNRFFAFCLLQAKSQEKLPSLYLIDSILKNLRNTDYASFFQQDIVNVFCHVFQQVI